MKVNNSKSHLKRSGLSFLIAALGLVVSRPALAYFSTIDTGDLIAPGEYQMSLEPQVFLSEQQGINVIGRFDTGLTDASSIRGVLGVGKVDFQLGAFYKNIPFPDTPHQPAIGGEAGVLVARVQNKNEVSLRLHPLISKRFQSEVGDFTPYASIPFGITFREHDTIVPAQFVFGAEYRPLDMNKWSFFSEVGINLAKAFSYISIAVAWRFDDGTVHPTRK